MLDTARALIDSVTRGTAALGGGNFSDRMVLVMGGPGAGKATHCANLAQKYGCVHLSVEKLMRAAVRDVNMDRDGPGTSSQTA